MEIFKAWPLMLLVVIALLCIWHVLRDQRKIDKELKAARRHTDVCRKLSALIDLGAYGYAIDAIRELFPTRNITIVSEQSITVEHVILELTATGQGIWVSTEDTGYRYLVTDMTKLVKHVESYL